MVKNPIDLLEYPPSKWALEIGLYKIYTFAQSVLCSGIKYLDSLSVGDFTIWHIANHTNP